MHILKMKYLDAILSTLMSNIHFRAIWVTMTSKLGQGQKFVSCTTSDQYWCFSVIWRNFVEKRRRSYPHKLCDTDGQTYGRTDALRHNIIRPFGRIKNISGVNRVCGVDMASISEKLRNDVNVETNCAVS
jgi:hypothetical protein